MPTTGSSKKEAQNVSDQLASSKNAQGENFYSKKVQNERPEVWILPSFWPLATLICLFQSQPCPCVVLL